MGPYEITAIMFISMLLLMATGLPIVYCLGAVGTLAAIGLWGPMSLDIVYFAMLDLTGNIILVCIPLFIFMGFVLHESGIANDLFGAVYQWAGGIRGALGMGTVIICSLMAAMLGVSSATTLSMGVIAVPAMLERKYNKRLAVGIVQSGGALGFLIPPSMMMVMYSFISGASVGKLFAGGIVPGFILALMYVSYIGFRCMMNPEDGPAIPVENRATFPEKVASLKTFILPILLIVLVLGSIFTGIASPTEASAVGAGGALFCAAVRKTLTWEVFYKAARQTFAISGFAGYLIIGALIFSKVYTGLGATAMIKNMVVGLDVSPILIIVIIQLSFFILGMFMDDIAILFMCMPIYIPIVTALGFDPIWFGVLFVVNMQMAYITPPYGLNLFYMKAVAPKNVSIKDIYAGAVPFLVIQAIMLVLLMTFPAIVTWLPTKVL